MQFKRHSVMLLSAEVAAARDFYVKHLGLIVNADLGWFVGMQGSSEPGGPSASFELSLCERGHPSLPTELSGVSSNVVLALEVADADAVHAQIEDSGVRTLGKPTTEPWGQRHFFMQAPDGVCLDIFQQVRPDPAWMKANGFA